MILKSYYIKIDDEFLPADIVINPDNLNIYINENDKKVLSFELKDRRTGNNVNWLMIEAIIGKKIELYEKIVDGNNEESNLLFGGQIDEPATKKINRTMKNKKIVCTDWNYLTEIRYINGIYYKQPISDIITKILDEYFVADGVTYDSSSIEETNVELAINCSYAQAQDVFDEISNLIAFRWKIDDDRKFYFNSRGLLTGQDIIEERSNYLFDSLTYNNNRNEYRNKQIFKRVNALTSFLTEKATPTPDNDNAFTVRLPLDSKPEIWITDDINDLRENDGNYYKVDPKYVGIGGLTEGLVWYYWNKGSNIISKDPNNAPEPAVGFFVVVKYYGQFQFDLIREEYDEIQDRAEIEGTSGVYENVQDGSNIDGVSVAEKKIKSILLKYAKIADVIEFESDTIDIDVNTICNMTFPSYEIDDEEFLLIAKSISSIGTILRKKYTFISGENFDGWVTFFKKWLETEKNFTLRESEEVVQPVSSREYSEWDGETTLVTYQCLYPANDLFPNTPPASWPPTITELYPGYDKLSETFGEEG